MKTIHCYPLASTGEAPVASLGAEFGGREDFRFRDWTHIDGGYTAGYLDAPDLVPCGSTTNHNFDELAVSTYVER